MKDRMKGLEHLANGLERDKTHWFTVVQFSWLTFTTLTALAKDFKSIFTKCESTQLLQTLTRWATQAQNPKCIPHFNKRVNKIESVRMITSWSDFVI